MAQSEQNIIRALEFRCSRFDRVAAKVADRIAAADERFRSLLHRCRLLNGAHQTVSRQTRSADSENGRSRFNLLLGEGYSLDTVLGRVSAKHERLILLQQKIAAMRELYDRQITERKRNSVAERAALREAQVDCELHDRFAAILSGASVSGESYGPASALPQSGSIGAASGEIASEKIASSCAHSLPGSTVAEDLRLTAQGFNAGALDLRFSLADGSGARRTIRLQDRHSRRCEIDVSGIGAEGAERFRNAALRGLRRVGVPVRTITVR